MMVFDGGAIIAGGIESVSLRAQAKRQGFLAAQAFRDEHGRFRQIKRLLCADADFLDDQLCKVLDRAQAD